MSAALPCPSSQTLVTLQPPYQEGRLCRPSDFFVIKGKEEGWGPLPSQVLVQETAGLRRLSTDRTLGIGEVAQPQV